MASFNYLIIFGVLSTFTALIVAPPPPGYFISKNFGECQEVSDNLTEPMMECFKLEFTPEQVNETRRLYNDSACLLCKHLCRKQEQIKECLREGVQVLKDVSNKSKTMVPFSAQLMETTLDALCDNGDEMFPVVTEEETSCFQSGRDACASNVEFLEYMDAVAFCDPGDPETDPLTMEYVCQKLDAYLDCFKENVTPCAENLERTFTILKTKLAGSDSCARYH